MLQSGSLAISKKFIPKPRKYSTVPAVIKISVIPFLWQGKKQIDEIFWEAKNSSFRHVYFWHNETRTCSDSASGLAWPYAANQGLPIQCSMLCKSYFPDIKTYFSNHLNPCQKSSTDFSKNVVDKISNEFFTPAVLGQWVSKKVGSKKLNR